MYKYRNKFIVQKWTIVKLHFYIASEILYAFCGKNRNYFTYDKNNLNL